MKRIVFAILVVILALLAILAVVYLSQATHSDAMVQPQNASPVINRDTVISLENGSAEVPVPTGNNSTLVITPTALPSADGSMQPPDGGSGPGGMPPQNGAPPGGSPPQNGAPPGGMPSNSPSGVGASPTASPTTATSSLSSGSLESLFGSGSGLPTSTTGTSTSRPTTTQQATGSESSLLDSLNLKMPTIKPILQ